MKLKSLIIGIVIFLIGLLLIGGALTKHNTENVSQPTYQIKINQYSLNFYSADLTQELFKISPFDDYGYLGDYKEHFVSSETFKSSGDLSNGFSELLKKLSFNQSVVSWTVYGKDGDSYSYQIDKLPQNSLKITRTIKTKKSYSAFGQSLVLCSKCYLTDQNQRMYFNQETMTPELLSFAQSAGLSPTLISQSIIPTDAKTLTVVDANLNPKLTVTINTNQQVFYDYKWNILEVVTRADKRSGYSQTITIP